jgi:(p)ppGpp synthase/HD superfamily hydrolase
MEKLLEQIKDFADKAHGEQQRKYTPEKYIVHPIRVMEMCQKHQQPTTVLAAALLHDVLEDTDVSKEELQQFLTTVMSSKEAKETTRLVEELTDVFTKPAFPGWNRRKRKRKEAERIEQTSGASQTVKYADIIDNCREIVVKDPEFAGLFLHECKMLLKKIPNGNATLYKEARDTVEDCLNKVAERYRQKY